MARATLKLKEPITRFDVDIDENSLEANGYVRVVRCKDCEHWERDVIFKDGWCRGKRQGNPNFYCADGERREDGEIH